MAHGKFRKFSAEAMLIHLSEQSGSDSEEERSKGRNPHSSTEDSPKMPLDYHRALYLGLRRVRVKTDPVIQEARVYS
jgi:hypothetical protein